MYLTSEIRREHSIMTEPIVYIDLGVGGMTCDDCVVHVAEALESVPGVGAARVDLASRSAVVTASPDVPATALAAAVRASGQYNAFERRRRPATDA
jgi:copper chaperone CopZ